MLKSIECHFASFPFVYLLAGISLVIGSQPFLAHASEPASKATFGDSGIPHTLKEAGMSAEEILGQASSEPNQPTAPMSSPAIAASAYPFIPTQVNGSFTSGPGVGYERSFFGIDGFFTLGQNPGEDLTYLQTRLLLDTNGNPSGNILGGYRRFNPATNSIFGSYFGSDVRDTGRAAFVQLAAGVEAVYPTFEARLNGYLPVANTRRTIDRTDLSTTTTTIGSPTGEFRFQGNSLILEATRTVNQFSSRRDEVALRGFDAEAGLKLWQWQPDGDLRSYLGLYYYAGSRVGGFVGVRGRLVARINQYASVGVSVQGDPEFGTTAAVTVGLTFPGVSRSRIPQDVSNWARMGESASRNHTIAVTERTDVLISSTRTINFAEVALNPATGQPYVFEHVILGGTSGNGTFESPSNTVTAAIAAAPGDGNGIVYVQPGTNPGIAGFVIKDGVQVLSTGPVQTLPTVQAGEVRLPLSGAGTLPTVTSIVTMGSNTVLGGFRIGDFGATTGIIGSNLRNVTVQDNAIVNLSNLGIFLAGDLMGNVIIRRNTLNNAGGAGGILVEAAQPVAAPLQITIADNAVSQTGGIGIQIRALEDTQATATIANNSISNATQAGIQLVGVSNSILRVSIDNNRVANIQPGVTQYGIEPATLGNAQMFVSLTNNQVANPNAFTPGTVEYRFSTFTATNNLCIRALNNRASNSGFFFFNTVGNTVRREPLSGNIGTLQPDSGTITNVAAGTCGF